MSEFNDISKPAHYTDGRKIEPKEVIEDWGLNFNLGNVLKYIARAGRKGSAYQDLEKAKQYIDFEIDRLKRCEPWNEAEMKKFIFFHKEQIKEAIKQWEDDLR